MTSSITELQEVCKIVQGGRRGLSGNDFVAVGYPAYGAGGLNGFLPSYEFEEPAVVLSSIGARCGKCFYADGRWHSLANTQLIFPNRSCVDPKYLWYQLNDERRWHRSGTAQPFIKPSDVKRHRIFLPTLPEQRRIAAILDQADVLRAKRRVAVAKLDELTQSIFLDIFGDPAINPKGWPECTLGDMFEICSSKRVHERDWKRKGIPFYRAREIVKLAKDGHVDNDLFISEELFKQLSSNGSAPQPGDLMVSAVGTLGACYEVRRNDRFYFKDASVLRFIPKNGVVPSFVRYAFSTSHVIRQIHNGSGSTVGTYTIARARQTRLYAPPIALQRRFARLLGCLADQTGMQSKSVGQLDILFSSLQHRAFRGEL